MSDMFTEDEIKESEFFEKEGEGKVEKQSTTKRPSVKQFISGEKFKADVSINTADIDSAFIDQASLFAYYATQCSKASEQVDNLKLTLDVVEAKLNNFYRNQMISSGQKVTEKQLENAVLIDRRYISARKAHNEAKAVLMMIEGAVGSFRQRKDMLVQLGSNEREERKGELFMKAKSQSSESYFDDLKERKRKMVG